MSKFFLGFRVPPPLAISLLELAAPFPAEYLRLDPEDVHVTLAYFGKVGLDNATRALETAARVLQEPIHRSRLGGLGLSATITKLSVYGSGSAIVVGMTTLRDLTEVRNAAVKVGGGPAGTFHVFRPHATIAKAEKSVPADIRVLAEQRCLGTKFKEQGASFDLTELRLYQRRPPSDRLRYETLTGVQLT